MSCTCGNYRLKRTGYSERPVVKVIEKKKAPKKAEPVIETEALEDKPEDVEVR